MRLKNFNISKLLSKQQDAAKDTQHNTIPAAEDSPDITHPLLKNIPPGVKQGRDNEDRVLLTLHKFGWLTTRQIAQTVWPDSKSSIAMARRVLNRLKDRKCLVSRALPQQNRAWVLSAEGVRRLHKNGYQSAKRGTDLLRGKKANAWFHRWLANEILIQSGLPFESFATEYEIQGFRSPLSVYPPYTRSYLGKIPDALHIQQSANGRTYLTWIEVELSKKRISDLRNLIQFIVQAFCEDHIISEKLYLSSIRLFFAHNGSNPETTRKAIQYIHRIVSELRKEMHQYESELHPDTWHEIRLQILENTIVHLLDIRQGPIFKGLTQKTRLGGILHYQNTQDIQEMLIG